MVIESTITIAAIDNGLAFPFKHPDAWRACTCISLRKCNIYTVSQKKRARNIMSHNCRKCGLFLIILSLSHSLVNFRKIWNKICHRTSNLLLHYLVKVECSTMQLYSTLFKANAMQNIIFYSICLSEVLNSASYVYAD